MDARYLRVRNWDKLRAAVLERDDYTCRYCGQRHFPPRRPRGWMERGETALLHVDHVVPISKGGTDDLDNLVTACVSCNLSKYDHVWEPLPLAVFTTKKRGQTDGVCRTR